MNHLHLAAIAAQHAAKWQPSHAEVSDIRIAGGVALIGALFGMYRTVTKPGRTARAATQAAHDERVERRYAGYEAD